MISDLEKISPVAIGLQNDTYTMACEKGSVTLEKGLELENVWLVPKLNCNLVSVSKLCKQLNCTATFYDDCYVSLIGAGEQRQGVYYYKQASTS